MSPVFLVYATSSNAFITDKLTNSSNTESFRRLPRRRLSSDEILTPPAEIMLINIANIGSAVHPCQSQLCPRFTDVRCADVNRYLVVRQELIRRCNDLLGTPLFFFPPCDAKHRTKDNV